MVDEREVNLFNVQPKSRNYPSEISDEQRKILSRFGKEYYDDMTLPGYRGYQYNGRWREVARRIVEFFNLADGAKILDVGCAKGFLLYDFKMVNPTLQVHGVDVSEYAIENALPLVKDNCICTSCTHLPYDDAMFDLVICVATLHNLAQSDCRRAIREINRVGKEHRFIMVHSYRNEVEKNNLLRWEVTIQLVISVDEWKQLFKEDNYEGLHWFQTFI